MQSYPVIPSLSATSTLFALCLAACGTGDSLFDQVEPLSPEAPLVVNDPVGTPQPVAKPTPNDTPPVSSLPPPPEDGVPSDGLPLDGAPTPADPGDVTPVTPLPPPEPLAPTIVSVSPANGATGVQSDAVIVITFSEPMNQALTQQAYQSEGIPSSQVAFSWNDAGTELTITPANALAYATGADPAAVPARRFSFFVSASAEDLEGHKLQSPQELSFSIFRQIETTFLAVQNRALSGSFRSDDTYGQGDCARGEINMCVGDSGLGSVDEQYKGFMSFDLSAIPAATAQVVDARLSLEITARAGNPFSQLGGLMLERTRFDAINFQAFDAEALEDLGRIATAGNQGTVLNVDVKGAVAADVSELSQYRLHFEDLTDGDGSADVIVSAWDTQRLSVTYLLP